MSLVHPRLVLLAVAAVAAVAMPILLLHEGDAAPRVARARFALPAPAVSPLPAGALSFALSAPPFDPDRSPGSAPVEVAAPAAAAPPPPPPPPAPRLVGVAAGGRGRAVALVRGADGETNVLSRGQSVDGWRLVAIGPQDALFELNGRRERVRLDFGNRQSGAARPGPAAGPPPVLQPEIPPPPARLP
jgi:hypothetical protein